MTCDVMIMILIIWYLILIFIINTWVSKHIFNQYLRLPINSYV